MKLKNREIDGVIFDVDGTLLDSMAIWEDAGARYLRSAGIEPAPDLGKILFPMIPLTLSWKLWVAWNRLALIFWMRFMQERMW